MIEPQRILAFTLLLVTGCTTMPRGAGSDPAAAELCRSAGITIRADFPAARAGDCIIRADGGFALTIAPEHAPPINPSAWYAFRLEGAQRPVTIELSYLHARHRYRPKLSADGETWIELPDDALETTEERTTARFTVPASTRFVAAQPLVDSAARSAWLARIAAAAELRVERIGLSHEGRPIELIDTGEADRPVLLLLGGQHPPEYTGHVAMRAFLATLLAETPEARRFRDRVRIAAVPNLNPDGVDRGHWRANLGGVDLNRDWGPFTQPETRAVRDWLAREGIEPAIVLDFHSTSRNLFYIQNGSEPTDPPEFARKWLLRTPQTTHGFSFTLEPTNANPERATSKNYFYRALSIPAITYEVGDTTGEVAVRAGARVLARDLMREMLGE